MLEGFWILRVQRPEFVSGGVVLFINGKVYGGDNGFAWTGTYVEANKVVKGQVTVHHFDPSIESVLGIAGDYEMYFTGTLNGNVLTGTAMIANQPQKSLGIRLTKRAEL